MPAIDKSPSVRARIAMFEASPKERTNGAGASIPSTSPLQGSGKSSNTSAPRAGKSPARNGPSVPVEYLANVLTSGKSTSGEQQIAADLVGMYLTQPSTTAAEARELGKAMENAAAPSELFLPPLQGGLDTAEKHDLARYLKGEATSAAVDSMFAITQQALTSPDASLQERQKAAVTASVLYASDRLSGAQSTLLVDSHDFASRALQEQVNVAHGRLWMAAIQGSPETASTVGRSPVTLAPPAVPSETASRAADLAQGLKETNDKGLAIVLERVKTLLKSPEHPVEMRQNAATMAAVLLRSGRLTTDQSKLLEEGLTRAGRAG